MKIIKTLLASLVALAAVSVNAEVKLADNSKILGKWLVNAESPGLDKEKKALNVSWEFLNNGTLKTSGEDTLGRTSTMDIDIKYSVENGVIHKQISPGREKYEDCTVVDMNDKDMTLKCKYLYFFLSRK